MATFSGRSPVRIAEGGMVGSQIMPSPFLGQIEPIITTPLGELAANPIASPITVNPKQYQLVNLPVTGYDYQLRYTASLAMVAAKLTIWEYLPAIPNTMPTHNPSPYSGPSFAGVEVRLDDLIAATNNNTGMLGNLATQVAQPETATISNSRQIKISPWSGSIGNHKITGAQLRRFVKLNPEPNQMTPADRIYIAVGEAGKGQLPGPEGWQFDYDLRLGGYYESAEEDAGMDIYTWSLPGGTDPIFATLTEGY
jgi:hypothetical protein